MTTERRRNLAPEEILDPELPICDSHHHIWDRPGSHYMLEEFMQDVNTGHYIAETVFVDCGLGYRREGPREMRPVGETESIRNLTKDGKYGQTRVAMGIVSFADLTLGSAVEPVLEAHVAAGNGRFRGIRQNTVWDPYPEVQSHLNYVKGLLLDPKFREGFACLQKYHLSFDAWLYFHQLRELVDLARAFPDSPIVMDHTGGPMGIGPYANQRETVFEDWKTGIATLSTCPNVFIKLGGIGMLRCGFDWHQRAVQPDSTELAVAMKPYFFWCIEHFGVERCMFESNFPVDKMSYPYPTMWNAFKRVTRDFSPQERKALFRDTAIKFYRL